MKINFHIYKSIYKLQLEKYFTCQYEKSMIVLQMKNVSKFLTILQMDISRHFCVSSNFGNLTGDRKNTSLIQCSMGTATPLPWHI